MNRADGTPQPLAGTDWLVRALLLAVSALYVATWWGQAMRRVCAWLPGPLCDSIRGFQRTTYDRGSRSFVTWVLFQGLIAGVPFLLLLLLGRRGRDLGLGGFNRLGWRLMAVGTMVSIPFGFLLMHTGAIPRPGDTRQIQILARGLPALIAEHMVVCGMFTALMLPAFRLPRAIPLAPPEGGRLRRTLRWIGLAQPVRPGESALAWFGLTRESLVAVLCSGTLFWLAHVGKPDTVEAALSLPGGVLVAYVTLRTGSIWPAIAPHLTMTLIPLGLAFAAQTVLGA